LYFRDSEKWPDCERDWQKGDTKIDENKAFLGEKERYLIEKRAKSAIFCY